MSFEEIEVKQKRKALRDWVKGILQNDFGEDFVYHEVAKTQFLHMNSRLQLLDVAQNSNGEIRHCEVFWDGLERPDSVPSGSLDGIRRLDGTEQGSVHAFKIVVDYGVEYDSNGEINNRQDFEDIFTSKSPLGLLPSARRTPSLDISVNGTTRTGLLSNPLNPVFPPTPKPLQSGSKEYAHYGEFRLMLTDM